MLEEEVSWGQHRVFSTKSVARAWEVPETPTPDGTLAREIARAERKAKSAVECTSLTDSTEGGSIREVPAIGTLAIPGFDP